MIVESIYIKSEYKNAPFAASRIRKICLVGNISKDDVNDVEISVIEAINNVIEHSYKNNEKKDIEIIIELINNLLEIRITDFGKPNKRITKPVLNYDPEDLQNLPERGMGLFIIDRLMDETNYTSEGNKNILTLKKEFI